MPIFRYAILYHNYYDLSGVVEMRERIAALQETRILLLCSLPEKFAAATPHQEEAEKFVLVPNVGKDIGGKLILIQLLLTLDPAIPYAILLHDKKSYQKQSGAFEKAGLFSIIEPDKFRTIADAFDSDASLGIVCARGFLKNEYIGDDTFATKNSAMLVKLRNEYRVPSNDLRFVAGTMFWIRTDLLRKFFTGSLAIDIRATLEDGNALDHEKGTNTHCWERMLSWTAASTGYKIREM